MRQFDGETVEEYTARFSGTFDIEPVDGETIHRDDEIMVVVIARTKELGVKDTRSGNTRLQFVFSPNEVRLVSKPELQRTLLHQLGFKEEQGFPAMDDPEFGDKLRTMLDEGELGQAGPRSTAPDSSIEVDDLEVRKLQEVWLAHRPSTTVDEAEQLIEDEAFRARVEESHAQPAEIDTSDLQPIEGTPVTVPSGPRKDQVLARFLNEA